MANNKMLIDAAHPEETRVVMVRGNRVDEFDFESEHKTQLRGNIYLAKVTRVEPSLQAAFVDYGGNRHGFLAFSEIHPDYYQIPVADRQALLEAEAEDARAAAQAEEAEDNDVSEDVEDDGEENSELKAEAVEKPARKRRSRRKKKVAEDEPAAEASGDDQPAENSDSTDTPEESDDNSDEMSAENDGDDVVSEEAEKKPRRRTLRKEKADDEGEAKAAEAEEPEDAPKPKRRTSRKKAVAEEAVTESVAEDSEDKPKPKRKTSRKKKDDPVTEEATEAKSDDAEKAEEDKPKRRRTTRKKKEDEPTTDADSQVEVDADVQGEDEDTSEADENGGEEKKGRRRRSRSRSRSRRGKRNGNDVVETDDDDTVDRVGSEDALEEVPSPPARRSNRRQYKIQEVIKRRQILLVQVVKEERGNKGAALTTYLSLAGRYSVLMPNTARGGGISRKITNVADRKRLKGIASALEVPQGMGVILRTAGATRDQEEIQRDFEYLMRLWENVRTLTLESTAPCLVYEEGSLIKRSIRDLYDKDTGEVMVAGEQGHREAKDFMTMLMPEHAKKVKLYKDKIPMFARMGVEAQLDAMLQPQVTLKSGGYLILDQTEALVAIDVNSGRSTRNHSVEETAVATNLEAADEVARQLRLRDLAGLIVIDFIDMEDRRNIRAVEKRLKDALKNDRARIQVGRISHFGLMEMSRQRIRASVLESTTQVCPVCEGLGHVRAPSSIVLAVLRAIEEHLNRNSRNNLTVHVSTPTALYLLNHKRENLSDLESRFGVSVSVETDDTLGTTPCTIEKGELSARKPAQESAVQPDTVTSDTADVSDEQSQDRSSSQSDQNEDGGPRKRRRRRRRKDSDRDSNTEQSADESEVKDSHQNDTSEEVESDSEEKPKRRISRRSKRPDDADAGVEADAAASITDQPVEEKPKRRRTSRKAKVDQIDDIKADATEEDEKPKRRTTRRKKADETAEVPEQEKAAEIVTSKEEFDEGDKKAKKGWWNRKFF